MKVFVFFFFLNFFWYKLLWYENVIFIFLVYRMFEKLFGSFKLLKIISVSAIISSHHSHIYKISLRKTFSYWSRCNNCILFNLNTKSFLNRRKGRPIWNVQVQIVPTAKTYILWNLLLGTKVFSHSVPRSITLISDIYSYPFRCWTILAIVGTIYRINIMVEKKWKRSIVIDVEWCFELAVFMITQGGDNDGRTSGLSVPWPSWNVLPVIICVVLKSSFPKESNSSKPPPCILLLPLLFFFFPFDTGFFRGFISMVFTKVVGVVFSARWSSEWTKMRLINFKLMSNSKGSDG